MSRPKSQTIYFKYAECFEPHKNISRLILPVNARNIWLYRCA